MSPNHEDIHEEEIRAWLRQYVGKQKPGTWENEFPTKAFVRFVDWTWPNFKRWINGYKPIDAKHRRAILRFIDLWEAGRIEIQRVDPLAHERRKKGRAMIQLLVRDTPKRMPMRLKVDVSGRSLTFVPRLTRPLPSPMLRPQGNVLDRLRPK